jgi:hypothetical protein
VVFTDLRFFPLLSGRTSFLVQVQACNKQQYQRWQVVQAEKLMCQLLYGILTVRERMSRGHPGEPGGKTECSK